MKPKQILQILLCGEINAGYAHSHNERFRMAISNLKELAKTNLKLIPPPTLDALVAVISHQINLDFSGVSFALSPISYSPLRKSGYMSDASNLKDRLSNYHKNNWTTVDKLISFCDIRALLTCEALLDQLVNSAIYLLKNLQYVRQLYSGRLDLLLIEPSGPILNLRELGDTSIKVINTLYQVASDSEYDRRVQAYAVMILGEFGEPARAALPNIDKIIDRISRPTLGFWYDDPTVLANYALARIADGIGIAKRRIHRAQTWGPQVTRQLAREAEARLRNDGLL